MIYSYPPEVHEFVKEWAPKLRDRDLAAACNEALGTSFTDRTMKSFRSNHKYYNGKKQWTKEEYWKYQTRYPKGMYEFIRDNSWNVSSKDMAEMCNKKFGTEWTSSGMKQFRQRHGIKSGVKGWYQKGHAPGNKGKKLEDIVTDPERRKRIREKMAPTQFKKGEPAVNEMPVGTIVLNKDSSKTHSYYLIKVAMKGGIWDRWKPLHRYVWEKHNGPIPEGMCVSFKDCDTLNCDIDNLMLITKGENVTLSKLGLRCSDPDATMAGLQLVRLKKKVKDIRKGKNHDR